MKRLLAVLLVAVALSGCSTRPPFQEVEPTIQFVAEGVSPKWDELTRTRMPKRFNKRINASMVSHSPIESPEYKLVLDFYGAGKEVTGSRSGGIAIAPLGVGVGGGKSKVISTTTVEVTAKLIDRAGKSVWSWSGYAEGKNEKDSLDELSDKIYSLLKKSGYLK